MKVQVLKHIEIKKYFSFSKRDSKPDKISKHNISGTLTWIFMSPGRTRAPYTLSKSSQLGLLVHHVLLKQQAETFYPNFCNTSLAR